MLSPDSTLRPMRVFSNFYQFERTDIEESSPKPLDDQYLLSFKETFSAEVSFIEQAVTRYTFRDDPEPVSPAPYYGVDIRRNDVPPKCSPIYDMGIHEAWNLGYSGKNVTVAVVDTGIEVGNKDLRDNLNLSLSYNFVEDKQDPRPPFFADINSYKTAESKLAHGVRVAGLVAATLQNDFCSAGVAYNASIAALVITKIVRVIKEHEVIATVYDDITIAKAWTRWLDEIDIYTNSWGQKDDLPCQLLPIGEATGEALRIGTSEGRRGKGSLYIISSGNGGVYDDCNTDGFANSVYTITINSVNPNDGVPTYAETCSCALASTYGQGYKSGDAYLVTTTIGGCTRDFSGNSASVAMAAGMCALALEANSSLTWRDVQHIIVNTSDQSLLSKTEGWKQNGVGRYYHPVFGFGLMNATEMIYAAQNWLTVPELHICKSPYKARIGNRYHITSVKYHQDAILKFTCHGNDKVLYTEQVIANVQYSFSSSKVQFNLTSPSGTVSPLLNARAYTSCKPDVKKHSWNFTSVHFWGENPIGEWRLTMINQNAKKDGEIVDFSLYVLGTETDPALGRSFNAGMEDLARELPEDVKDPTTDDSYRFIFLCIVLLPFGLCIAIACCYRRQP